MNNIQKKKSGLFFSFLLQLVTSAVGVAAGFCGAAAYMADSLYQVSFFDRYVYAFACEYIDAAKRTAFFGKAVLAVCAAALVFVLLTVALSAMAGRYKKCSDGGVYLNWFDRIWTEIHFVLLAAFASLAVMLAFPVAEVLSSDIYFDFYIPYFDDGFAFEGIGNTYMLILCGLGMFVCLWLALSSFLSIVRKLKAKSFWSTSLIGKIVIAVGGFFSRSSKSLLNAFSPRAGRMMDEIAKGVSEVKGGNLTYKIPVGTQTRGICGELNGIASGINDISSAAEAAVANELKNQRLKTELISNVSHDLKTPLTSIVTYVDLLKNEGLDCPAALEYLDILDQKTQRLRQLTENLFDAAKAASGNLPCKIESINLGELVNQALGETDEKLKARGLDVIVKNTADVAMVKADGQLLWRVIDNLLSNVCKYSLENSRVYIDIARVELKGEGGGKFIGLQVKNISKDQLNITPDELMERFTRGDQSRNTEGSGLGLSIAKDLTQLMHGSFNIAVDGDLFKALLVLEQAD